MPETSRKPTSRRCAAKPRPSSRPLSPTRYRHDRGFERARVPVHVEEAIARSIRNELMSNFLQSFSIEGELSSDCDVIREIVRDQVAQPRCDDLARRCACGEAF